MIVVGMETILVGNNVLSPWTPNGHCQKDSPTRFYIIDHSSTSLLCIIDVHIIYGYVLVCITCD